jgi:DNA-binding transcriptional LysR family regulator
MTLNQLGYFYQAAVLQHFNQAAEKMNISEPSLSRSIAALEDELCVTLFEKRGRNVILTKAGEIFLEHATQILDDVKRAENKMHHLATDGGHIDIAYVSPLAREYIPRTVRNFLSLEQNKNITFNFNQDITSVNIEG